MYFIVNNKSKLGKTYWDYIENIKNFAKFGDKFLKDNGFETKDYYYSKWFMVEPTQNDIEKFEKQMTVPKRAGSRVDFRKNCKLQKLWDKGLEENNIDTGLLNRRDVVDDFVSWRGGFTYNIFDIDGVIYFLYEPKKEVLKNIKNFKEPDFTEIKASEYYKIIEDYETREAKKATEKLINDKEEEM